LGAAVELADSEGLLFTSRLSTRSHPWLADHSVFGTALFPATAFLELAIRAGDQVGCDQVEELILESPLAIPPNAAVLLQPSAGRPGRIRTPAAARSRAGRGRARRGAVDAARARSAVRGRPARRPRGPPGVAPGGRRPDRGGRVVRAVRGRGLRLRPGVPGTAGGLAGRWRGVFRGEPCSCSGRGRRAGPA